MRKIFRDSAAELKNARGLTLAALLAAIFAVSYSPFGGNIIIFQGSFEIRLGFLAIAVAAVLFGPVPAMLAAFVGDIIGTLLFYGGSFFWGYTLSWILMGLGFGVILYKSRGSVPRVVLAMLFNTFVISMLFTTTWQLLMGFGPSFTALFLTRLPRNLILLPVNTVLAVLVLRAVFGAYEKVLRRS